MNIEELKMGDVLFHPKKIQYVQIKEITKTIEGFGAKSISYHFVTSGFCDFFSDSQTTITRQVMNRQQIQDFFYLDPVGEDDA